MGIIVGVIFLIILAIAYLIALHRNSKKEYVEYNKSFSEEQIDEIVTNQICLVEDDKCDHIYMNDDMPLGRVSAFLNYFNRNIYNEEPYAYYCKRSSRDTEFREYGCVIARTGIYLSEENTKNKDIKEKDNTVLEAKDSYIKFSGLTKVIPVGSLIMSVNFNPRGFIDEYHISSVDDALLRKQILNICKCVIQSQINYTLQKGLIKDVIEEDWTDDSFEINDEQVDLETEASYEYQKYFDETEKKIESSGVNKGIAATGVQAVKPRMHAFFGEVKNLMNGSRGHGVAAEYANSTMDRASGRSVVNLAQQLDENGRQVKNGADRLVNGVEIQTKYYKTASETIGAAFDKKQAVYIRSDGSGKMMQIEVPRDQYKDALIVMQKRIDNGQVPNVSPGEDARTYVRKGYFTYEQSYNVARAGTVESLTVDATTGAVCCIAAAGITSVMVFALAMWQGNSPKESARQCLSTSLAIMTRGTLIYTLTMQLSRKEVALAFAGKAFTKDGISQGYMAVKNPIYTASENLATKVAGSNIATSKVGQAMGLDSINGRQIIGGAVTFAVVFGPDIVRSLQGKISTKQLFKNTTVAAAGMAGAAVAQAAVPIPIVSAIVGGAVAGIAAKKTLDHFIEDDAKEMFRILKEEFIDVTMLVGLSKEEFDEVSKKTVGSKSISKMLEKMYQSENRREYARLYIMQPAIIDVTGKRQHITNEEYEQGLLELIAEPS